MKTKIFSGVVLFIIGIIFFMCVWSSAAALVTAPNTIAVLAGLAVFAVGLGIVGIGVYTLGSAMFRYLNGAPTMLKMLVPLLILPMAFTLEGCTRVDPGYVGIKVNMYGSDKGVEELPLVTGRVWYNPWTEDIYVFPTFMQTVTWTQSKTEESPNDDSITFNSIEGAVLNVDISLAYTFIPDKVPTIFKEFRQDAKSITWKYIRSQVRDAFSRHASAMKAVDIFGSKKQELLKLAKSDLNSNLGPKGFKFDMVSFVGAFRADQNVTNSINAVIQAAQKAIEAENKVRQATAEADQAIEKARGEGESTLIRAKKQAEANITVAKSVTPELIHWATIEKWNGVLPNVTGGAIPMVQLPQGK
jgi:regulator of protease activity HflC (stomatin/prohibitin superfamily)